MSQRRLIVVDGYNLILRTPQLKPGEGRTLRESRAKLVNLLAWAYGTGEARFLVVFDGAEGVRSDERGGRVEIRYAKPPQTADDVIRGIVEHEIGRDTHVTVVTSDLEVARHARAMGADVNLADFFLASALDPAKVENPEKPVTMSRKELEEWAQLFKERAGRAGHDEGDA